MEILKSLLNEAFEGADEDDASDEALKDDVEEDDGAAENAVADAVWNADFDFCDFLRLVWVFERVEFDEIDEDVCNDCAGGARAVDEVDEEAADEDVERGVGEDAERV